MTTAASQDTEITLGTGKMLALFFGLVALCAVFFSVGFSLGRTSVRTTTVDANTATIATTGGVRPSAVKTNATPPADMTFYKAVQGKDDSSQATSKEKPASVSAAAEAPQPAPADPAVAPPTSGYFVQVAAVSKTEDADALVDALKKKQYPAFTTSVPTDKLIHVQVGPYAEIKDAEAMRAKLVNDGYNPILKK
jgi:cell division septation protein DedD